MVSLPCGEEGMHMGFRVGFSIVTGVGVWHGVLLGIGKKLCGGGFLEVCAPTGVRTQTDLC